MLRDVARMIACLVFAFALLATPRIFNGRLPLDIDIMYFPGFLSAAYLEALGITTVSDWRGDLTDHGESIAFAAAVAFWWAASGGVSVLVSRRTRKRRLTSR